MELICEARKHVRNTQPMPLTSNAAAAVDRGGVDDLKWQQQQFMPSGPLWVVAAAAASSPGGGGGGGGSGGSGVRVRRMPAGEEDDTRASAGVLVHKYLLTGAKVLAYRYFFSPSSSSTTRVANSICEVPSAALHEPVPHFPLPSFAHTSQSS